MPWLIIGSLPLVALIVVQATGTLPFSGRSGSQLMSSNAALSPPSPRERINITVDLTVTYDQQQSTYTYAFTIANAANAQNAVSIFGIADAEEPVTGVAPPQWTSFYGFQEKSKAIVWTCVDTLTQPPGGWPEGQPYPSAFDIQPGETKSGFTFTTRNPPTAFTFYAQGFDSLPHEEDLVNTEYPTLFTTGVSGGLTVVGVAKEEGAARGQVELSAPRPNPARGYVTFGFHLPTKADVLLGVYDLTGRRIRTLLSGQRQAGSHAVTWDGSTDAGPTAPSGVYFARLLVDGKRAGRQRVSIVR